MEENKIDPQAKAPDNFDLNLGDTPAEIYKKIAEWNNDQSLETPKAKGLALKHLVDGIVLDMIEAIFPGVKIGLKFVPDSQQKTVEEKEQVFNKLFVKDK